jgi:O-antigen/teichoic acid export membrane protein
MSDMPNQSFMPSHRHMAATIGKNAMFGVVASIVQIATRFVSIPVVIHYLGLGGYGIWSIIMVTAAYMRFGSAGIKSAFQKYVAEATATGDYEKANKLLSTGSISMSQKLAQLSGVPSEFLFSAAASIAVLAVIYTVANFGAAFEAIVMGGQRIDLTRKVNTILSICEAVAIIALLRAGFGLLAMTFVMGASELIYIMCCYRLSHGVVPQMHISVAHFTKKAFPELIRFAGSYQLVNILEMVYGSVVPIVLLKFFGADAVGIASLAQRLVAAALIAQDSLILPILSGAAMVFASGSRETLRLFLGKSFKVTLAAALPPLAFVSSFGASMIYAWTGQADPKFRLAVTLISLAALLNALSLLQLVLYRASGRAMLDNIRQVLRIIAILIVAFFAGRLGFEGVLAGMAAAQLVGVVFMFIVMAKTFHAFSVKILTEDTLRIVAGTALVLGAGAAAGMIPIPWSGTERMAALIKLVQIGLGCLLMLWPALIITRPISGAERRAILDSVIPGRRKLAQASQ